MREKTNTQVTAFAWSHFGSLLKILENFKTTFNSPGNFLVRNEALVIIDFETVTTVVDGVRATEIPMGPSLG